MRGSGPRPDHPRRGNSTTSFSAAVSGRIVGWTETPLLAFPLEVTAGPKNVVRKWEDHVEVLPVQPVVPAMVSIQPPEDLGRFDPPLLPHMHAPVAEDRHTSPQH